jgi:hypothetical protein
MVPRVVVAAGLAAGVLSERLSEPVHRVLQVVSDDTNDISLPFHVKTHARAARRIVATAAAMA